LYAFKSTDGTTLLEAFGDPIKIWNHIIIGCVDFKELCNTSIEMRCYESFIGYMATKIKKCIAKHMLDRILQHACLRVVANIVIFNETVSCRGNMIGIAIELDDTN